MPTAARAAARAASRPAPASRATSAPFRPASSTGSPRRSSLFNASEHPRTVAGSPARWGCPTSRCTRPTGGRVVNVVVSWELCWYRYEVDLSDEVPSVRVGRPGLRARRARAPGAPEQRRRRRPRPSCASPSRRDRPGRRLDGRSMARRWRGSISMRAVIYCVVPEALADDLLGKLTDYYADDPNVTVIVDRRRRRAGSRPRRAGASASCATAAVPRCPARSPSSQAIDREARPRPRRHAGRPRRRRRARQSRARPRSASWSRRPTGRSLDEVAERIGVATNNVAEYRAVLRGIERAARARRLASWSWSTTPSSSPASCRAPTRSSIRR